MACKVLILAEHEDGSLKEITFELLGMAHRVAGQAGWTEPTHVKAMLLGKDAAGLAEALAKRGAGEVVYADGSAVADYTGAGYRRVMESIIRAESPELVLIGHTPTGWDVAPLVAAGLDVPLATGCSTIKVEGGRMRFVRKAFNGKFVHEVEIENASPLMATMDKGAAEAFTGSTGGAVRKIDAAVSEGDLRARFVEVKKGASGGLDLTQAQIIVSGGRGIGAPEKLGVVRDLADALGGQVGASRAVTDAGWLPHEHQIGSSGVTVSPKLYVAAGISGAIQHVVGMKGSGYIVAINKDADAPIFGVADVGVVGDLFEYLPALTRAVKQTKG
ncbi:MAG: electron transfer flavoprotein subunit alpha/FixB family protein [Vicinamibacteria bacterium]